MSEAEIATPAATETPVTPAEAVTDGQTTPVEAPATQQDAPAKTDEQPEKQGKSRFERRLDRAYRKAAEEKARADFLDRQLREREAAQQPKTGFPKIEDFNYDPEKFAEAVAKTEREKAIEEIQRKQRTESQQAMQRDLAETWSKHSIAGEEKYDDFDVIVGDLKPTHPWSFAVMTAENAPDVAYYLGTHLDEAKAIAKMDPVGQIRAIGRLEAKLAMTPAKPKISAAPAPIKPVSSTGNVTTGEPDPSDTKKWIAWRQKQVHGQ